MIKDVEEIRSRLKNILMSFTGPIKVRVDKLSNFEVAGTIEAMQGKQLVDGIYFSSIVPKEKDVRFYFYPTYTHPDEFNDLSDSLKKFKKGKSCFHVKYLNEELEQELIRVISKAIEVYKKDGLLK